MKKTQVNCGGVMYDVHLQAVYGEYNCGNKTTGRLTLIVTKQGDSTNVGAAPIADILKDVSLRNEIIKDYLHNLSQASTYKALNSQGTEFFPTDTGTYPPGVLMYADSVDMPQGYMWYNNWKALIDTFEMNPDFGVVVLKSPIMPNRFYGPSKPSRVWTIVLPSIAKHICWDKYSVSEEMKKNLESVRKHGKCNSEVLDKDLVGLGI